MMEMKINRSIYSDETIQKAVRDYQDIASITIDVQDKYVLLSFVKCKYDEERTIREFENYLIGLENS